MFENLHQNQKIAIAILVIISLTFFILTLYFALRKTNCPPGGDSCKPAAFVRFSKVSSGDNTSPWTKATWYKYSYLDKSSGNEGNQSPQSEMVLAKTTETNPIIQVTLNTSYNIKVYRAIDNGDLSPGDFTELKGISIETDGTFTDTDNPAPPPPVIPPTPKDPPKNTGWGGGTGGGGGCGDSKTYPHCSANGCTGNQCQKENGLALCTEGAPKGGCALPSAWETPNSGCTSYCMADQ